jgi:hypothetical protein
MVKSYRSGPSRMAAAPANEWTGFGGLGSGTLDCEQFNGKISDSCVKGQSLFLEIRFGSDIFAWASMSRSLSLGVRPWKTFLEHGYDGLSLTSSGLVSTTDLKNPSGGQQSLGGGIACALCTWGYCAFSSVCASQWRAIDIMDRRFIQSDPGTGEVLSLVRSSLICRNVPVIVSPSAGHRQRLKRLSGYKGGLTCRNLHTRRCSRFPKT